jgi:hypothetical protein
MSVDITVNYPRIPVLLVFPEDSPFDPELVYLTRIPCVGEEINQFPEVSIVEKVEHHNLEDKQMWGSWEFVATVNMTWNPFPVVPYPSTRTLAKPSQDIP